MSPAAFRTVGEPGFAFLSHCVASTDIRFDSTTPVPSFRQTPCHRIRDPEHRFMLDSDVLVARTVLDLMPSNCRVAPTAPGNIDSPWFAPAPVTTPSQLPQKGGRLASGLAIV